MAYVVPCVRFNDVVRMLMSEVCVPVYPAVFTGFSGSLKSLASLLQRRDFLYSTVTSRTELSVLLHHCNTRYEWLVRPCSTGSFTLQETPSFAWRTNGLLLLMGQISGIAFILGMDSFKSPATGLMTMPLLTLIGLMVICLIFGIQLKEAALDIS